MAVPRSLYSPVLHPILMDCLTVLLPIFICAVPAIALLLRSLGALTGFEAVLSQGISSSHANATLSVSKEQVQQGFTLVISDWRLQGYARATALLVLIGLLATVETRVRSRLTKVIGLLRESEEAILSSGGKAETGYYGGSQLPVLARSYSGRSASGYSGGSDLSSCSSMGGKKHLMLPQTVQLDLPSPSLMKDGDLEYAYPELAHREVPKYGEPYIIRPGGPRRMGSIYGSERSYGDQAEFGFACHSRPATPIRSMSRQTLLLPQLVRSRTYASSRHSCSCGSGASAFEYEEKASSCQWQGPYGGPSSICVSKQRSARLVEGLFLGGFLLLSCIFEGLGAALKTTLLEDRRVSLSSLNDGENQLMNIHMLQLEAAFQIATVLLQILPILGGLLLSAARDNGPAYGWPGSKY